MTAAVEVQSKFRQQLVHVNSKMWFKPHKKPLQSPEVETEYGRICGKNFILPDGKITNVFLGIPFAKPPIGELRFEKPQPPDPWDGCLNATKYKSRSIQKDFIWDLLELKVGKSEDCLYLNIMTPEITDNNKKYAVMVYIHGGGFVMDSAVKYHYSKICRNIVSKDVIFVTLQYRLGFLGFFTTDDETSAGNYGMWDQCMALKFIKNNISNFGGNPDNITVLGQSAGAVSVDLLSLSPYSRDLFDKMILMAGNAETMWSVSPRCRVAKNCREKAIQLGFRKPSDGTKWTKKDNEALLKFMKMLPANKLGLTMVGSTNIFESIQLPVTPVIDGDFLPKNLIELRKEAPKKLIIAGDCEFEGLLFLALGLKKIDHNLLQFVKHRASTIILEGNKMVEKNEEMSFESFENLYSLNNEKLTKRELQKVVVKMIGDTVSGIALQNFIQQTNPQGSTVYTYNFQHYNSQSLQGISYYLPFSGATHCSEINSLFDINMFVSPYIRTVKDKKVTNIISTLFTNFAKCGNPNGSDSYPSPLNFEFNWDPITPPSSSSSQPPPPTTATITGVSQKCLLIKSEPKIEERKKDFERCLKPAKHFSAIHNWMTTAQEDEYNEFSCRTKAMEPSGTR